MSKKRKIKTAPPPTQDKKMSEIILKFAWTYAIQEQPDPQLRQNFMNVACSAWNISLLFDEDREHAIETYINNMRKTSGSQVDENNVKALENDLRLMISWKLKEYPTIRKMVLRADLSEDIDKIHCMAASADYDAIVKAKLAKLHE
jgi:hypothetical protein